VKMKSFWELGFRSLFFLGTLFSSLFILIWVFVFTLQLPLSNGLTPGQWHGQQMIYGFTIPVIVGFVLTASQNWTGTIGVTGRPLHVLAGIWLFARLAAFIGALAVPVGFALDGFFIAYSFVLLWPYLKPPKFARNSIFLVVLGIVFAANFLSVYFYYTGNIHLISASQSFVINNVVIVILVIARRVIPFFTERVLTEANVRPSKVLMKASFVATVAYAAVDLVFPLSLQISLVAGVCAAVHLALSVCWYDRRIWKHSILWILHLGYFWIFLGFALKSLAYFFPIMPMLPLHAFTTGGVGVIIYGMVSRVSLGHTGRKLVVPKMIVTGYILINLAAIMRVFGPLLSIDLTFCVISSGVFWSVGFLFLLIRYTPIWFGPRLSPI
jgi:uncharacterized protein involved in response to NO